jgi:hypothetical protein
MFFGCWLLALSLWLLAYLNKHLLRSSDFGLQTSNFNHPTLEHFCFGFDWWVVGTKTKRKL